MCDCQKKPELMSTMGTRVPAQPSEPRLSRSLGRGIPRGQGISQFPQTPKSLVDRNHTGHTLCLTVPPPRSCVSVGARSCQEHHKATCRVCPLAMPSLRFLRLLTKLRHWGTILKAPPTLYPTSSSHRPGLLLPSLTTPPPPAGIKHRIKAMETESQVTLSWSLSRNDAIKSHPILESSPFNKAT